MQVHLPNLLNPQVMTERVTEQTGQDVGTGSGLGNRLGSTQDLEVNFKNETGSSLNPNPPYIPQSSETNQPPTTRLTQKKIPKQFGEVRLKPQRGRK